MTPENIPPVSSPVNMTEFLNMKAKAIREAEIAAIEWIRELAKHAKYGGVVAKVSQNIVFRLDEAEALKP